MVDTVRVRADASVGWEKPLLVARGLVLESGELNCVLGPNGSGKTTLLKTLAGALKPLEGSVVFEPVGVEALYSPPFPPVGVGLDGWSLLEALTRSPGPLGGGAPRGRLVDALGVLEELEFQKGLLSRGVEEMSTGEAMKVLLAGALASGARALFLDEPSGHLDLGSRSRMYGLLRKAAGERLVVVSLHDVGEAAQVCGRAVLLGPGGLVAWGDVGEVLVPQLLERAYGVGFRMVEVGGGLRVPLPLYGVGDD